MIRGLLLTRESGGRPTRCCVDDGCGGESELVFAAAGRRAE
jgi:hypothetical protein